jgi:hypothetical protein
MSTPPDNPPHKDDPDSPSGGNPFDKSGDGGQPQNPQQKQFRVVISASAHDVKFADFFGYQLNPDHGVIKFGTMQAETGEFVVHTQIAMTPQGMMALSEGLKKNIENARKQMKPNTGSKLN